MAADRYEITMDPRGSADNYMGKRSSAREAIGLIRPGQRVFIGSGCGEPQLLVRELADQASRLTDLEIIRLLGLESSPLTRIANQTGCNSFILRSFYLGSAIPETLSRNKRFLTPINLSALPRLLKSRQLPIQVALIQVSPPDLQGRMSLGISVDISLAAAQSADLVIAQVNPRMPRVPGRSFLYLDAVDVLVEGEEDLLTIPPLPESGTSLQIARQVSRLIEDGSTLQVGLGSATQATLEALSEKKDLGVHTHILSDGLLSLMIKGIITNRKKGFQEGKTVASAAVGSRRLYAFLDDNPAIEFHPSDYVSHPGLIARHRRMVSLNMAMAIDLTGQVAVDALAFEHFSGVSEVPDFIRGASESEGGKSILLLPSGAGGGKRSRIVANLESAAVVIPRGEVQYVATEFGVVNLFGKSLEERALALISIARPDFRRDLFLSAKTQGVIGPERGLPSSLTGIYARHLEETRPCAGGPLLFRPVKPTDERLVQEHFYNLDREDIIARFLHEKWIFTRRDVAYLVQVDYAKDLTLVAVSGEGGDEKVVGIGGYFFNPARNQAEVAFSVLKAWQKKGIGRVLLEKLVQAACENKIKGFFAVTSPRNQGMARLFKNLPFPFTISHREDTDVLSCRFNQPAPPH
jgi:acyl-CoA hydrolase